jgi:hypothetical protein
VANDSDVFMKDLTVRPSEALVEDRHTSQRWMGSRFSAIATGSRRVPPGETITFAPHSAIRLMICDAVKTSADSGFGPAQAQPRQRMDSTA